MLLLPARVLAHVGRLGLLCNSRHAVIDECSEDCLPASCPVARQSPSAAGAIKQPQHKRLLLLLYWQRAPGQTASFAVVLPSASESSADGCTGACHSSCC